MNTGSPVPPKAAIAHARFERKVASTGCAAVSAEGLPSASDKAEKALIACGGKPPERRKVYRLLTVKKETACGGYGVSRFI